jgi:hypothetical protein
MKVAFLVALIGAVTFGLGIFAVIALLGLSGLVLLPLGGAMILWGLSWAGVRSVRIAVVGLTTIAFGVGWTVYYSWLLYPKASCVGIDDCSPPAPLLAYTEFWLGPIVAALGVAILLLAVVELRRTQKKHSVRVQLTRTEL